MKTKKIIIVGAGMAGLSFAYECLLRGHKVMIVEASPQIGGLAKSIFHNDCFLDIGVHLSYLKDPEVYQKVSEIVDKKYWVKVIRKGKLYIKGRYIDWPLRLTALYQLPFGLGINIFLDQLKRRKFKTGKMPNYQDELLKLYGPSLYYSFFHPITKKFLKVDPKKIHPDWAYSTLRGSTKIEDESFKKSHKYHNTETDLDSKSKNDFNIFKFVIASLTTKREDEPFYYFKNGFGMLVDEYRKKILKLGGVIKTNSRVEQFILNNKKINACIVNNRTYETDEVVWTGDPFNLCKLLGLTGPSLEYLNTKYVYFFLKKCNKDYQVCYYADPGVSFVRGSIFSNHSKTIIRNKKISDVLCLEYSFKSKNELFQNSDVLRKRAIKDLIKVNMINDESDIESIYEINVPNSYPLLTLDYREKLEDLKKQLNPFPNLIIFGRQGTFNYNNTDIIIKETLHHPMFKQAT